MKIDLEEFERGLTETSAPGHWPLSLKALWYDSRGQWHAAHDAIQDESDSAACWIHAYLHRKEGDMSNARYWYHQAGRPMLQVPLETEFHQIAHYCLQR